MTKEPPLVPQRRQFDVADGVMMAVVLIWAANNVIVKATLDELSPLAYVLGRFLIVVGLMFAWLLLRRRLRPPERRDWPRVALAGVSGYAVYNALFTIGLERTSAFSVALLISLGPVFTMLLASWLGLEGVRRGQWLGVVVAAAGVALFVGDKLRSGAPTSGDALSLAAAAAFAVYSLATGPLVRRYGAPNATAWSALVGLVVVAPFALPAAARQAWGEVSLAAWVSLLYASILSMLVAYTLWAWAIERRGVGRTVPYLFLVPVVSGALAAVALGERFGSIKIAGGALVLVGTALVRGLAAARATAAEAEPTGRGAGADPTAPTPAVAAAAVAAPPVGAGAPVRKR